MEHVNALDELLQHLSPVVTVDSNFLISYYNRSFVEEFSLKDHQTKNIKGKNLFDVIPLKSSYRLQFEHALSTSRSTKIQNREFKIRSKLYGYSIFPLRKGYAIILKEITDIKKLEAEILNLHKRLIHIQEDERKNIAAELHDGVGQTILAAKLNFILYHQTKSGERFKTALSLIDAASDELRGVYNNLYPTVLRDIGLHSAIHSILKNTLDPSGIQYIFDYALKSEPEENLSLNIYRVVQEICSNVIKHSKANHFTLTIKKIRTGLEISAADDGIGHTQHKKTYGYGLMNIQRRIEELRGVVQVDSQKGFRIKITIPAGKKQ